MTERGITVEQGDGGVTVPEQGKIGAGFRGLLKRNTVARAHQVALVEGGAEDPWHPEREPMPNYWQAYCKCGWFTKSYHGETLIREAAERHVFQALTEVQLTPGGGNVEGEWT